MDTRYYYYIIIILLLYYYYYIGYNQVSSLCIEYFNTLVFFNINYKYLILSEKRMNPFLIVDTGYTYRGCGIKTPDLPSEK